MLKKILYTGSVVYTIALNDHQIRIVLWVLKQENPWYDHIFRGLHIFQTKIDINVTLAILMGPFIYTFSIFHVIGFVPQCEHKWYFGRVRDHARRVGWTWELRVILWLLAKKNIYMELADMDWTPGEKKCIILSCIFCLRPESQTSKWNKQVRIPSQLKLEVKKINK